MNQVLLPFIVSPRYTAYMLPLVNKPVSLAGHQHCYTVFMATNRLPAPTFQPTLNPAATSGSLVRGFLTSSLLPNKGHLQFIENSWKRLGSNRREGSRAALLRDLLPSQSTNAPNQQTAPSLSSHLLLSSRSNHSPRGFAAWAAIAAKGVLNERTNNNHIKEKKY